MPILSKRVVFVVLALCAMATLVGVIFSSYFGRKTATKSAVSESTVQTSKTDGLLSPDSEIASIKDLIDGEYQFPAVDTSTWKTYRNDEMGFEVKIPQNLEVNKNTRDTSDDKGLMEVGFGEKDTLYPLGEGTYSNSVISVSVYDRHNANVMPLREYLMLRDQRNSKQILKLLLGGVDAICFGDDEVFAYQGDKEWNINFQMVSAKQYLYGKDANVEAEREIISGFLQTFQFIRGSE